MLKTTLVAALFMSASTVVAQAENTQVRFAYLLSESMLPALYADGAGYFEEAGLDVEMIAVQNGPASVAAVVSGEADLGFAAPIPPINANLEGVPIKIFMSMVQEVDPDKHYTYLIATGASGIAALADLPGKKITFNANGGGCELAWREHMMEAGIAWDQIEPVVLPMPQQEAALEEGSVDAACTFDPFYSSIKGNAAIGAIDLGAGMLADNAEPVIGDAVFAQTAWLDSNMQTASKIMAAIARARSELLADRAALEAAAVQYMELTPDAAKTFKLPAGRENLGVSEADIQKLLDAMVRTGMREGPLSAGNFTAEVSY